MADLVSKSPRRPNDAGGRLALRLVKSLRKVLRPVRRFAVRGYEGGRLAYDRLRVFSRHEPVPGVNMRLYHDSALTELILRGDFEQNELAFATRFLKPGDLFWDVGANVGLFSLVAGRAVGPGGRVVAFEPASRAYSRLRENVALNPSLNIQEVQAALSDEVGDGLMQAGVSHDAWNSLAPRAPGGMQDFHSETVRLSTVDAVRAADGPEAPAPALVKIDVEGWETRVLAGGRRFFSDPAAPPLLVEFSDEPSLHAGSSCEALYQSLLDFGYRMYRCPERWGRGDELRPEPFAGPYDHVNLIALKDEEAARRRLQCVPAEACGEGVDRAPSQAGC